MGYLLFADRDDGLCDGAKLHCGVREGSYVCKIGSDNTRLAVLKTLRDWD